MTSPLYRTAVPNRSGNMMSETLEEQTERLRKKYAFSSAGDRIHRTEQYFAEFDAWLTAVQAAAWDKGHDAARTFYAGGPKEPNPYDEGV